MLIADLYAKLVTTPLVLLSKQVLKVRSMFLQNDRISLKAVFACRIIISPSRWYFRWWLSRCIHQFWPSPDLKVVRGYGRQLVSGPISSNHGQQTIFNRAPATPAKQVSDPRLPSTAPLSKQVRVDQPSNSGSSTTRSFSLLCSSRCGLHWVKYYSPPKIFR